MTALFSFVFGGIFFVFVVAAIVGHVLVLEALVRPFFGKLTVPNKIVLGANSPLPRPAH